MVGTTDIAQFLAARLDEDEAAAHYSGPARVAWLTFLDDAGRMLYTTVAASNCDDDPWVADGHVLAAPASARVVYDPARVLAEAAAKREHLRMYVQQQGMLNHVRAYSDQFTHDTQITAAVSAGVLEAVVRQNAAVYSDHPDYNPAWRVQ